MLLSEFAMRRQKETCILTTHKIFVKTHIVQHTEQQLRHNINKHVEVWFTRKRMGPLKYENTLQVDKKNKKLKSLFLENEINYQKH